MRNRFILSTRGRCSMRWETFHPIHSSRSSRSESGAAEADSPKPSVVGSHQIAQRPADQPTLVERMLADHQFIPDPQILLRGHLNQSESLDVLDAFRDPGRSLKPMVQASGVPLPW